MSTTDSIIQAESGGDPNAQNPNSSASGPGQFVDSTWTDVLAKHRPDLAALPPDQQLALKNDPQIARDMTAAYAGDNQAVLSKAGLPVTPGSTYLAHFAGPAGAVKVLQADPGALASDILGPKVLAANPFLKDMTAQGLQAWAAKKMGTTVPAAGAQAAPDSPAPPQAPAIPQQAAPIFAAQPRAAPQAPQTPFAPVQPMSPIFAQPHKQIDLSGLRAMLAARAPIFPQGQS